jgi:pyruvate dehydrogenase E2 component (dihydrolipoamide acetyltransferase)
MPSLGADMEVGTIIEWRVQPGDRVHRGDIVAVVDTEKADIEVEIFDDGVIDQLLVEVGRQVPVGTPLATIASTSAEAPRQPAPVAAAPAPAPAPAAPVHAPATPPTPVRATASTSHVRASPLARRLADERGVHLDALSGSGPGGAIVASDVPASAPVTPTVRASRHEAMRAATAELMARSKREIPHYYLATTVNMGPALEWMAAQNLTLPVAERLLPAALLLKATALAARDVPTLNGFWTDSFHPSPAVHLGVAVSLRGGGLIAPAIHDADALSVHELMAALLDLVARARSGRLRSSEMSDPTLTVTNLGEQGADEVFGVIYPPQVALVGVGKIVDRPTADGDLVVVRPTTTITLAADHRTSDGHEGSRLLAAIARRLQTPEEL